MPPAIIAAAVGIAAAGAAAAGYIALTTALVITIAASAAGALLTKTKVPSLSSYSSQQERKQVLRSSTAPQVYIYGRTVVSGLLFFAEEEAGNSEKEWLHLAIAIAGHEIDAMEAMWLADAGPSAYGSNVTYELHNNRTTPDPFMLLNCVSWKTDMIGKGICWARVSLKFDQDLFPSGLPNIQFQVRGKKVYDPRDGVTRWSDNAALCILDYYKSVLNVPDAELDFNSFINAANICDEYVATPEGNRRRYTINGPFDLTDAQSSTLDDLHKACAGEPTYMAGRHGLLVGAYYGPATMEIHEGQIISDVKIIPEAALNQKLNTVTGTFLDAGQKYTESDYPVVSIAQYVTDDGYEYTDDLKLRFVSNEYQAQSLATIKINRTRIGRSLQFTMNLSGYQYRPGYYVNLYLPQLGINGEEFRITDWSFSGSDGVNITLKQETAAVWSDVIGRPIERPDITDFPVATMPQPVNLLYTVTEIGEVVQGILSWTNIGAYNYNIVTLRQDGVIKQSIQVPGQSVILTGMVRGTYQVGVMAVSQMGVRSVEAYTEIVIQAPDAPVSCDVAQGYFSITLKPKLTQLTNVSTQFDFWTSGEVQLTDTSVSFVESHATRAGIGQTWSSEGLLIGHTYYWYIRSINAFGSSNFLEVAALCDSDISGIGDIIDNEIRNSSAFQNLKEPINNNVNALLQTFAAQGAHLSHTWKQAGEFRADILRVESTVVDLESAQAQLYEQVQVAKGDITQLSSTVATKMTAIINKDGTASAQYDLGLQVVQDGVPYKAGLAMSIDPSGGTYKSTVLVQAGRFAVYDSEVNPGAYKLVFGTYNGQVYLDDAIIRDASIGTAKIEDAAITNAKIGAYIQSDTYVAGSAGWKIAKDGTAQFLNGYFRGTLVATSGQFSFTGAGGVLINSNGVRVNLSNGGYIILGEW